MLMEWNVSQFWSHSSHSQHLTHWPFPPTWNTSALCSPLSFQCSYASSLPRTVHSSPHSPQHLVFTAQFSHLPSSLPLLISKMIQNEASHTCANNAQMSNFILEVSSKIQISIPNYPLKISTKEFLSSTSNLLFLVGGHSSLLTVEY